MRVAAFAIVIIATIWTAAPARAQTYDPKYPVCLELYGEDGSYYYCNLTDPYLAYPKSKAATCPNFNPVEVSTWCK